jgi:hypothetical protein
MIEPIRARASILTRACHSNNVRREVKVRWRASLNPLVTCSQVPSGALRRDEIRLRYDNGASGYAIIIQVVRDELMDANSCWSEG